MKRRALAPIDAVARAAMRTPIALPMWPNPHRFSDRTVLVTGASSGIGEAVARRFGTAGADVVLVARRTRELERVARAIRHEGGRAETRPCDLTDRDAVQALAGAVTGEHGPVAVLVNNAGRSIKRPLTESLGRLHDFDRTMAINYFGPVALTLALLPSMIEAGHGRVVNVSTWGTRIPSPEFAAYTASKAAIDAFGRAANAELSGTGVSVGSVHVPLVRTPMITPAQADYRGMPSLSAEEAAGLVLHAAASTRSRVEPAVVAAVSLIDAVAGGVVDRIAGRGAPARRPEQA